jgi:hypothetical protein
VLPQGATIVRLVTSQPGVVRPSSAAILATSATGSPVQAASSTILGLSGLQSQQVLPVLLVLTNNLRS